MSFAPALLLAGLVFSTQARAAIVIDTFSATPATAQLNGGDSNDTTGTLAVASGSLGNQRNLTTTATSSPMPVGQSATLEVDSGPGVLQMGHTVTASKTRYETTVTDTTWPGSPFDLAGALGVSLATEIQFEIDFVGAILGGVQQLFIIDILTNGGEYQYAGLMTSPGAQTLTLGYLSAASTPNINEVIGFNLVTEIDAGTGTASDFIISEVRAIPEPSAALLGGLGALLLLRRRRA